MALSLVPDLDDPDVALPSRDPEAEGRALYAARRADAMGLITALVARDRTDDALVETG